MQTKQNPKLIKDEKPQNTNFTKNHKHFNFKIPHFKFKTFTQSLNFCKTKLKNSADNSKEFFKNSKELVKNYKEFFALFGVCVCIIYANFHLTIFTNFG